MTNCQTRLFFSVQGPSAVIDRSALPGLPLESSRFHQTFGHYLSFALKLEL